MSVLRTSFALVLAVATGPAWAHTGMSPTGGFGAGLAHPLGGIDHALAMVAVGLIAAAAGGRALWAVPASFVGMMGLGSLAGSAGLTLPAVELAITLSTVAFGVILALGRPWPVGFAAALVGIFAVFHGHTHGAEMPAGVDFAPYGLGFSMATTGLIAGGIGLGLAARLRPALVRWGGAAAAATAIIHAI